MARLEQNVEHLCKDASIALEKTISCGVEICRDRHDRRSCKIFANCVNFPGKQRDFMHNMHRSTRFTHTKCAFALKIKIVHTQLNYNKKATKITDVNAFMLFLL